jgi:hypothetical protein
MLLLTLVPIVLLSEFLAIIVDFGIEDLGLPAPLGGVMIAILVLSPEGLTAFHAALVNHLQRAVNVCLGSALATIGLTIPAVLIIGLITGYEVHLGLDEVQTVLLILTLFVSGLTFGGVRTHAARHGAYPFVHCLCGADLQPVSFSLYGGSGRDRRYCARGSARLGHGVTPPRAPSGQSTSPFPRLRFGS